MLLGILLLAATASTRAGGPVTQANWYKQPSAADLRSVWPADALRQGIGGKANICCRVNIHGVAEDCRVVSETPSGRGFGGAALLLTPQLLFKPATRAGVPEPSFITIPIAFRWDGRSDEPHGLMPTSAMIDRPVWAAAPTFADVASVYPKGGGGVAGYVAFECEVNKEQSLRGCDLVREEPPGRGFEGAARRLIAKFRVRPDPGYAAFHRPLAVNLRIRLVDPTGDDYGQRRLSQPQWLVGLDPDQAVKLFPTAAAAQGLRTGVGLTSCQVTATGSLTDCKPLPGKPDGLGFSEAAVVVAGVMKMNLWTEEGGPIDGATLVLPVRFNLADAPAKAP
jgi:TonB family protein